MNLASLVPFLSEIALAISLAGIIYLTFLIVGWYKTIEFGFTIVILLAGCIFGWAYLAWYAFGGLILALGLFVAVKWPRQKAIRYILYFGWAFWLIAGFLVIALIPLMPHKNISKAESPIVTTEVGSDYVLTINGCPTASVGAHPNTGEPLIFKANPYPGVVCEYEFFSQDQNARIVIPAGQASLVQDWAVTCPTGPACEGTWVATGTIEVPAGWLVHMWVYSNGYSAAARFPSFSCEYLDYGNKDHTNENIRTAPWALESGNGSTLDVPACAGFSGVPGK